MTGRFTCERWGLSNLGGPKPTLPRSIWYSVRVLDRGIRTMTAKALIHPSGGDGMHWVVRKKNSTGSPYVEK
jgi:hypothetical protein